MERELQNLERFLSAGISRVAIRMQYPLEDNVHENPFSFFVLEPHSKSITPLSQWSRGNLADNIHLLKRVPAFSPLYLCPKVTIA